MTLEKFNQLLQGNNAIKISKELVIYNDYELYNYRTEKEKHYNSIEELVNDNPDVKKIIEEAEAFYYDWSGGRGSSSSNASMGGGFGSAKDGFGKDGEGDKRLFPAELNIDNKKGTSVEHVLDKFQKKYGDADREYGISVDENGYVTQHIQGGKHSVSIQGGKGETIIHNHPSGSNFSDADLHSFAQSNIKSIVATSSNDTTKGTYQITKTDKFNAKAFDKAINKAKWDTNKYGYNDGADWWLKKNQKKYGYTYTSKGMKNAGKDAGW